MCAVADKADFSLDMVYLLFLRSAKNWTLQRNLLSLKVIANHRVTPQHPFYGQYVQQHIAAVKVIGLVLKTLFHAGSSTSETTCRIRCYLMQRHQRSWLYAPTRTGVFPMKCQHFSISILKILHFASNWKKIISVSENWDLQNCLSSPWFWPFFCWWIANNSAYVSMHSLSSHSLPFSFFFNLNVL